jgi:hypothetical protein
LDRPVTAGEKFCLEANSSRRAKLASSSFVTVTRGDFGEVAALIAAAVALAAGLGDGLGEDVTESGTFGDETDISTPGFAILGDVFG